MTLPGPSQWAPTLSDYPDWYPGQAEAFKSILTWLQSPTRFMCIEAPTGSGKSLLAMLSALLTTRRTVILTATKGLQDRHPGPTVVYL
jgi:superfamily II DNA or RNA helicase